ncbi:hypothetical protein HW571_23475 [Agrobacterium genomosp. 3]|uniref:hypothetical protein n=1 Tax=Rhizobium/Agrobacterium group TaxID=227290 RepID=UPI00069BE101|nr:MULTISPECIES: hypothetical protein [Rhizobium/Agrobacterium group]MCA1868609.1 hypothetical protein [Agrobacterium tomkonis]KRA60533.1 hypothetical protein ASD85_10345 [Rhizobium sp. Root651]MCA1878958.1 hypothetical protein [Agrobacterium tumefaciens]MCA1894257.1 hypothetical protein [Agrobacterium tomkonis]QCL89814.1 hypothetical protein CFBP6623_12135 [Agrobacterium tumefaciens]
MHVHHLVDGSSAGYDDCAKKWLPRAASKTHAADDDDKPIARKNRTMQWLYGGKPPYRWEMNEKPGNVTDDGVGNIWHIIKE